MRLKIWLLVFSVIACAQRPKRPSGELCTVDIVMDRCYCTAFGESHLSDHELHDSIVSAKAIEHPIEYCHKHISFKPKTWEAIQNNIDELRAYIEQRCDGI